MSKPFDDVQLGQLMIHLLKGTAPLLLESRGEIPPYSIRLIGAEAAPKIFYPQDANPGEPWPLLVDIAVDALRADEDEGDTVAVALCTGMVADARPGQVALGAQIETARGSFAVFAPYQKRDNGWQLDEPEIIPELLFPDGLRWHPNTHARLARAQRS